MSQVYEFKLVALGADDDCASLRLIGKFDKTYSSQVFLRVPLEELSKFSIGQIYSLVAQDELKIIETVPLDAVKLRFEDGSPVPEDAEAGVERRGGYRL
jgi:hypothetical protein